MNQSLEPLRRSLSTGGTCQAAVSAACGYAILWPITDPGHAWAWFLRIPMAVVAAFCLASVTLTLARIWGHVGLVFYAALSAGYAVLLYWARGWVLGHWFMVAAIAVAGLIPFLVSVRPRGELDQQETEFAEAILLFVDSIPGSILARAEGSNEGKMHFLVYLIGAINGMVLRRNATEVNVWRVAWSVFATLLESPSTPVADFTGHEAKVRDIAWKCAIAATSNRWSSATQAGISDFAAWDTESAQFVAPGLDSVLIERHGPK